MIKVAIVEDDFRIAAIHEKFLLKIDGVTVVGKALNGEDAMSLLKAQDIDLLLLDVYMPDQLGTELLVKIRSEFPNVDIIMITAAVEKDLVEISLRNGVADYIIKPVTLERFIETIKSYKKKHFLLHNSLEINQKIIDEFLGKNTNHSQGHEEHYPKGIDPLTLQKVKQLMKKTSSSISAEEMGEMMGASRTTARRYLEYISSIGECSAELEYGIVGRPERRYKILQTP